MRGCRRGPGRPCPPRPGSSSRCGAGALRARPAGAPRPRHRAQGGLGERGRHSALPHGDGTGPLCCRVLPWASLTGGFPGASPAPGPCSSLPLSSPRFHCLLLVPGNNKGCGTGLLLIICHPVFVSFNNFSRSFTYGHLSFRIRPALRIAVRGNYPLACFPAAGLRSRREKSINV